MIFLRNYSILSFLKFSACSLLSSIVLLQNGAWSLGEDGNFNEFLQMVEEKISEAENYKFPKDNGELLEINSAKVEENGNFNELLKMVQGNISEAQNYTFPKDNSRLLEVDNDEIKVFGTFDFIVIGSGAAGAIIANRLSEISEWNILLLEAGGQDNDFTKILGMSTYSLHSDFSWGYNTTTQKNACLGMVNEQCFMGLGKVIGGGTTINGALYSRGHPEDFNRWVTVYGNPGWSYQEILPYFKKSEDASFFPREKEYHGVGGYFTVSQANVIPGLVEAITSGFGELGLNYNTDYNGPTPNGISRGQYALKGNERVSTATAFLNNFKNRPNLHVSLKSFVTRLLIRNNIVHGVEFVKNGQIYIANATKEVILSAGSVNSPQILMLSGIGPMKHLNKLSIPVIKNLPVGKNFQDHVMFTGLYFRTNHKLNTQCLIKQLKLYVKHKRPLTSGFGVEMVGLTNFRDETQRPSIEYLFSDPPMSNKQNQFTFMLNDNYTAAMTTNPETDFSANIVLLHPKSRGAITLKSNNPKDKPNVNPNFLTEQEDIEALYESIQFILKLNNTQAFKEYGAEILLLDYPNCEGFEKLSKDWWICGIRHLSTSVYHPLSSNRMGPDPKTSVVNTRLQVHDMKGLRVVDGSVLPELTSGHTMTSIMMVAEKAADLIKQANA